MVSPKIISVYRVYGNIISINSSQKEQTKGVNTNFLGAITSASWIRLASTKVKTLRKQGLYFGGDDGSRTHDLGNANAAL